MNAAGGRKTSGGGPLKPRVFVLGVLHDSHVRYQGYTYWHIIHILNAYQPDLIGIEVSPEKFAAGDFRMDSPEKWGIVLPWGTSRGVPVVPVDRGGAEPEGLPADLPADQHVDWADAWTDPGAATMEAVERRVASMVETAGGLDALNSTYTAANSRATQELYRAVHALSSPVVGPNWDRRNRAMGYRTADAITRNGASRAIVVVGCEHKYALDELLVGRYGLEVLQLEDFLTADIVLTADERIVFARGEVPITYPSDLMFIHRLVHGGEPHAYMLALPEDPSRVPADQVESRIAQCLGRDPRDANMLYYRGLCHYVAGRLEPAVRDFDAASWDSTTLVGLYVPLWELATLRKGQMLDLLGARTKALVCYIRLLDRGSGALERIGTPVAPLVEKPFAPPRSAKGTAQ